MEENRLLLPVYVTAKVAGKIVRLHENTVRTHCRPEAWREDSDGARYPLYTRPGVEAWRAEYRDGRLAGGDAL